MTWNARTEPLSRFRGGAKAFLITVMCMLSAAIGMADDRTQLKPPWNLYPPQTDIQVGRQNAQIMERRLPLCNDPKIDAYLTRLGMKLVAKLPTRGIEYPWEFHCVNSKEINAFALPGGFVFINRGAIEVADNEAQLAAVMAHEISHVAMRHGTAQLSKAQFAQGAAGIFGALFGGSAGGALLSEGVAAGAAGLLLHYSRADETQADVLGTQVLYDVGYDPRAMAQFFEKLEGEIKGKNPPQFLSDHPDPGNRIERVDEEIDKLGGVPANGKRDSSDFEAIKREVLALPVVKRAPRPADILTPPPTPSADLVDYQANAYILKYPSNWIKYEDQDGVTFAPENGILRSAGGQAELAYGVIVSIKRAKVDSRDKNDLRRVADKFIAGLQQTNPNLRVVKGPEPATVDGQAALSTHLSNDSPAGGKETDWLVTVLSSQGPLSVLSVTPESAFPQYENTFHAIVDSLRLSQ